LLGKFGGIRVFFVIFAEEIATGGGEGIATYFLRFSKTYIKA
jgi:hypothetical protein